jgi:hypothetical protein
MEFVNLTLDYDIQEYVPTVMKTLKLMEPTQTGVYALSPVAQIVVSMGRLRCRRVEHRDGRPLHDLIFKGGNRERPQPTVRLGYIDATGRQGPIRSSMEPRMWTPQA